MRKHLFIKGDSGIGKTSLLLKCISPYALKVGGFLTQRLLDDDGSTFGFSLASYKEELPPTCQFSEKIQNIFIKKEEQGFTKYPDVFINKSLEILKKTKDEKKEMALLDEIGGIELSDAGFEKALYAFMEGEIPCIGVLKNNRNYNAMKTRIAMEQEVEAQRERLEKEMKLCFSCEIIEITKENYFETEQEIKSFLQRHLGGKCEKKY